MLSAFGRAFKTPDLRRKLLFTLAMIVIYRVGTFIPAPGVSYGNVQQCLALGGTTGGIYDMVNLFSGGALLQLSIFALGVGLTWTFGKAVGDGNNYAHWLLWSHGGMQVDEAGKVAINSPETVAAIEYAKKLYATFIPGTESWLDINNNRAFLSGDISLTANGVSLYYAALKDEATLPSVPMIAMWLFS